MVYNFRTVQSFTDRTKRTGGEDIGPLRTLMKQRNNLSVDNGMLFPDRQLFLTDRRAT